MKKKKLIFIDEYKSKTQEEIIENFKKLYDKINAENDFKQNL